MDLELRLAECGLLHNDDRANGCIQNLMLQLEHHQGLITNNNTQVLQAAKMEQQSKQIQHITDTNTCLVRVNSRLENEISTLKKLNTHVIPHVRRNITHNGEEPMSSDNDNVDKCTNCNHLAASGCEYGRCGRCCNRKTCRRHGNISSNQTSRQGEGGGKGKGRGRGRSTSNRGKCTQVSKKKKSKAQSGLYDHEDGSESDDDFIRGVKLMCKQMHPKLSRKRIEKHRDRDWDPNSGMERHGPTWKIWGPGWKYLDRRRKFQAGTETIVRSVIV